MRKERRTDVSTKAIMDLLNKDMSAKEIAFELDLHVTTVHKRANSWGYRFKRGGSKPVGSAPKKKKPKKQIPSNKKCSCCGKKYVPNEPINGVKLTRLCVDCWRFGENRYELF